MLRRSRRQFTESIDTLRSQNLRKYTDVYTSDGERIGVALRFVHRPIEDVNEEMRLYRTYLVVQSILLGGPAYVPTLYIADYEAAGKQLDLAVEMHNLKEETWNREPDFVVRGLGVFEELPE